MQVRGVTLYRTGKLIICVTIIKTNGGIGSVYMHIITRCNCTKSDRSGRQGHITAHSIEIKTPSCTICAGSVETNTYTILHSNKCTVDPGTVIFEPDT